MANRRFGLWANALRDDLSELTSPMPDLQKLRRGALGATKADDGSGDTLATQTAPLKVWGSL